MASAFYYWKSNKDQQWWFHLKENNNGEIILSSTEGYQTEQGCLKGITSTQDNAPYDRHYNKFPAADGKYYFTLKAGNHEPISRSEGYSTSYNRDQVVEKCKTEAPFVRVRKI